MHVAVVVHSRATDHLGGSEQSLLSVLDSWAAAHAHLKVTLISPTEHSSLASKARERGFAVEAIPYQGWILPDRVGGAIELLVHRTRDAQAVERIATYLKRAGIDLVVTNTLIAPWGAFAAALEGIPHVWFVRESLPHMHGVTALFGPQTTLSLVGELSHTVVANSQGLASELAPLVGEEKITWCYPRINAASVREAADDPPRPDDIDRRHGVVHIVVAGRVARAKGQWRVIEALPHLKRGGVPYEVTFVGQEVEGGATEALMARARRLGVAEGVRFLGERDNPHPYVAHADIAVIPSDWETFGRATADALTLSRAVVASRCGGMSELIEDRKSGLLFDRESPADLGAALLELARDPALRKRLGIAAAARAASLEQKSDTRRVIDVLNAAAGAPAQAIPPVVAEWLAAPRLRHPHLHALAASLARLSHVGRRLARIARNPVAALRRRLARSALVKRRGLREPPL